RPRRLLGWSAALLLLTMGLYGSWAVSEFFGLRAITLDQMVAWHGVGNAIGFIGGQLLAWQILRPRSPLPAPGIPFSRLAGSGRVGPDFFQRLGAVPTVPNP